MVVWFQQHQPLLWWMAGASVVLLIGSAAMVPWMLLRLPADYFMHHHRHRIKTPLALRVVKNLLGGVLLAAGVAMLVLPGQGLLTLFVALTLIDFPGKYAVERAVVSRAPIARALNWVRARGGKPPLEVPHPR